MTQPQPPIVKEPQPPVVNDQAQKTAEEERLRLEAEKAEREKSQKGVPEPPGWPSGRAPPPLPELKPNVQIQVKPVPKLKPTPIIDKPKVLSLADELKAKLAQLSKPDEPE